MTQKVYNLIVLDASGSMYSIRREAIAGVVETIQTIRTSQAEDADHEPRTPIKSNSSVWWSSTGVASPPSMTACPSLRCPT